MKLLFLSILACWHSQAIPMRELNALKKAAYKTDKQKKLNPKRNDYAEKQKEQQTIKKITQRLETTCCHLKKNNNNEETITEHVNTLLGSIFSPKKDVIKKPNGVTIYLGEQPEDEEEILPEPNFKPILVPSLRLKLTAIPTYDYTYKGEYTKPVRSRNLTHINRSRQRRLNK